MSKIALITGIYGQDGAYLAKLLLEKGYNIFGIDRNKAETDQWRLRYLGIIDHVILYYCDITDTTSLYNAIRESKPDEIYHLAAYTSPGQSLEHSVIYGEVNGLGVTNILEAVKCINPGIKVFLASSSEILEKNVSFSSLEKCKYKPENPYAIAKLYGYWMSSIYRDAYNIFISNGIMYNHESPLRGIDFVTRKISNEVARIKLGLSKELVLGNIDAKRDWGCAQDYVRAMWMMLQQEKPKDYIVATGENHSVKDFLEKAFSVVNLNWKDFVKSNESLFRPYHDEFEPVTHIDLNYIGWHPEITFDKLVEIMVTDDMVRWKRHLNGERFPWDVVGVN